MFDKKFVTILSIIVGVIVVAGIAVVLMTQKSSQPEPVVNQPVGDNSNDSEVITSDIDTSDWQTYRNEELGLEFSYPEGWVLNESNNQIVVSSPVYRQNLPEGGGIFKIEQVEVNLEQFIDDYNNSDILPGGQALARIVQDEKYFLDGQESRKLTGTTAIGIDQNFILFTHKGQTFIVQYHEFDSLHKNILRTIDLL